MAIGTLGRKIIFEVSDDYMFTFKDMTREITSRWANHEPQGGQAKAGVFWGRACNRPA